MKELFDAYLNKQYNVKSVDGKYATLKMFGGVGIYSIATRVLIIYPNDNMSNVVNLSVTPEDKPVIREFLNYLSELHKKPFIHEVTDGFERLDNGIMTVDLENAFAENQPPSLTSFEDMLICLYSRGISREKEGEHGRQN